MVERVGLEPTTRDFQDHALIAVINLILFTLFVYTGSSWFFFQQKINDCGTDPKLYCVCIQQD